MHVRSHNVGPRVEPQRGPAAKPLVRVLGANPAEAETLLALECPTKAAKFGVLTQTVSG